MRMKARIKKKSHRTYKDSPSALRLAVNAIINDHEDYLRHSGQLPTDNQLFLVDENGELTIFQLNAPEPEAQYEEVRRLCNEHKTQLAIYVVPSTTARIDVARLLKDPKVLQQISMGKMKEDHSQSITVDLKVDNDPCVYFYGATRDERLAVTMVFTAVDRDAGPTKFRSEIFDSKSERVVTKAGNIVPINSWFDGVEWSPLTLGLSSRSVTTD